MDWSAKPAVSQTNKPPPVAPPVIPAIPPHTNTYSETWVPLVRWSRENHAGTTRQFLLQGSPACALSTSNGEMVVRAGDTVAKWDGMELHLGFEPQWINGQPFIHVLDLKKNIEPLLQPLPAIQKTNPVIVIDPGHGGLNTGTRSVVDGECEKEFTLDWARRLEPLLASNGWQVFLTRTNDVDISLSNRVAFAELHKADLFLSLHFNAARPGASAEQKGVETYCLTPAGMPSTLKREYEDDPALVFPNNAFDAQNLQYAVRLHRALLQGSSAADHGIRKARFMGVLRGQIRPAILIEGGYLSDPHEARQIANPGYRQLLAEAVAAALKLESEAAESQPEAAE